MTMCLTPHPDIELSMSMRLSLFRVIFRWHCFNGLYTQCVCCIDTNFRNEVRPELIIPFHNAIDRFLVYVIVFVAFFLANSNCWLVIDGESE